MSWFKRKVTPVVEDLIEPVEVPQSDVQLAVEWRPVVRSRVTRLQCP